MDCLFCKIIKGDIPSKTLYEDDIVKVIMDVDPHSNGHTLIIPKRHFSTFEDLDNDTLIHVNEVAKKIKCQLYDTLNPDGLTLVVNYGITQKIKHYHLHIVPVYEEKQEIKDVSEIFEKIMN
jgi:histidine triad (HIT) family protein